MNVFDSVLCGARVFPKQAALIFGTDRYSYSELEQLSAHAAGMLEEWGIRPGDRVVLVLGNVPAFPVWYYAILRIGATAVSISTRLSSSETAFIISDCGARAVLSDPTHLAALRDELPDCVEQIGSVSETAADIDGEALETHAPSDTPPADMDPDAPAVILYTSGTTGFPKGATLSHRNIRATVHAFNHLCEMRPHDRLLIFVPLFHCYGQNALLNAGLNVGATLILQPQFDPQETKALIAAHRVNRLFGVPTTFQLLHERCAAADLESVEYCFSAAATLPIQLAERWCEKFGMPIYEGYGLTETAPFASYNHRLAHVPGSIGTPVDLVEMKIVDPDTGAECAPGTPGEIAIRGPNVMLGYWNRPDETAEALRDGWFHSGDMGRQDERGYFFIVDRLKDMISVGGLKVFPAEVERVLLDHPSVAEAAVVGFPDSVFEEKVVAFVTAAAEAPDRERLRAHCRKSLAGYKVPAHIEILAELPRVPSGKVRKTTLRERKLPEPASSSPQTDLAGSDENIGNEVSGSPAASRVSDGKDASEEAPEFGGPPAAATPRLLQLLETVHPAGRSRVIRDFIQDELTVMTGQQDRVDPNEPLLQAGLDSLMIVDLTNRLQQHLGGTLELPATLVFDYPRIRDLADFLGASLENIPEANSSEEPADSTSDGKRHEHFDRPSATGMSSPGERGGQTTNLSEQIASLSDEEALQELLRELDETV